MPPLVQAFTNAIARLTGKVSRELPLNFGPVAVADGHSDAFATDAGKQRQWDVFSRNLSGTIPGFGLVVSELRQRLAGFLAVP